MSDGGRVWGRFQPAEGYGRRCIMNRAGEGCDAFLIMGKGEPVLWKGNTRSQEGREGPDAGENHFPISTSWVR